VNGGVGNVKSAGKGCRVCVDDCHQVGIFTEDERRQHCAGGGAAAAGSAFLSA